MMLAVTHNLYFYNELMQKIRDALDGEYFESFYQKYRNLLAERSQHYGTTPLSAKLTKGRSSLCAGPLVRGKAPPGARVSVSKL